MTTVPNGVANKSAAFSAAIILIASFFAGCAAVGPATSLNSLAANSTVSSVAVSPGSAATNVGGTIQFAAAIQGTTTNKAVTWKVSAGSINSSGLFTAPATAGTATVVATSSADSTKTATATIAVAAAASTTAPKTTSETPTINSLIATPASITTGQKSTIEWSVTGGTSLSLSGVGTVTGSSGSVAPSKTTTYTLTVTNAAGSTSKTVTVSVAASTAPTNTTTPPTPTSTQQLFTTGVVTHFGQDAGNVDANTSLIQAMGATTIRDEVYWKEVEHSKGSYALPSFANPWVNAAVSKGLKPLITLDYGNPLYDNGDKPTTPDAIEAFAAYAEFIATQFKGRVMMYEVWNEWDRTTGGTTAGTPQSYVNLLKVVYPRLKAVDPNIIVLGGGISAGAILSPWFGEMLQAGALKSADAISIHEYIFTSTGSGRTPETLITKLQGVETTMRTYNGNQDFPLYLTETGWPTNTGAQGTTLAEAGDFNAETTLLLASLPYLKGIWWYDFQDNGSVANYTEDNFGLVHVNLSPKPGYYALMDTIAWMAGAKFSARMTTSDPTVDGIKLTLSNGQQAMALWRIGAGSSSVEVTGSESTQSINANVAGTTTFAIKSPQVQDLTESPVWFVGDSLGLQ
jgi:polysaccharide biosynthesis protein PslG